MPGFRVAICQLSSVIGTEDLDPRRANLDKALAWIEKGADDGAELILFGEMYLCGYRTDGHLFKYVTVVDPPDNDVRSLVTICQEKNVYVIMGTATTAGSPEHDIHNSALFVGPEGLIGVYHKTHLATLVRQDQTVAMERCFYSPGKELPVFPTPLGSIGIQICFDNSFPEVSRVLTLKGAEVLVTVSAAAEGYQGSWDHSLPTRAAENQVWCLMVSVVGNQRGLRIFGGSRVVNPNGEEVARARYDEEDYLLVDIDLEQVRHARRRSHIFGIRKPSLYAAVTETEIPPGVSGKGRGL